MKPFDKRDIEEVAVKMSPVGYLLGGDQELADELGLASPERTTVHMQLIQQLTKNCSEEDEK